jgi:hypothetical protein
MDRCPHHGLILHVKRDYFKDWESENVAFLERVETDIRGPSDSPIAFDARRK